VRAIVLGAVLSLNAMATTIVAIWTPEKLVITGDSLINSSWTGQYGEPRHKLSSGCKIHQYGSNYISAAGNYHIQTAGFDVWESAMKSCGSWMTVDSCTSRFKAELRSKLARAVGVHEVYLSVIVAGFQNGAPALDHITLIGQPDGRLSVQSESFRKGLKRSGRVILGERDAIDRYERGVPAAIGTDLQGLSLRLVKIEARARPQEVGSPFSTLTIDASGERWTNPGCCPSSCSK
jgi:hypothetical protein